MAQPVSKRDRVTRPNKNFTFKCNSVDVLSEGLMASHQVWAKVEEMSLALSKAKDGLSESVELSLKALS